MFVLQVVGMAALACGMISVGSCNGEVTSTILQTMMERSEADLKETYSKFLALGLALTYLGTANTYLTIVDKGSVEFNSVTCCLRPLSIRSLLGTNFNLHVIFTSVV